MARHILVGLRFAGLGKKLDRRWLVTGRGAAGSWQIRGRQLGNAIGAMVDIRPSTLRYYDAVIVVKRIDECLLQRLHDASIPIVWDIVDAWPQPIGNSWPRELCMAWLAQEFTRIRPDAVVVANDTMRDDCMAIDESCDILVLPHHSRPECMPIEVRDDVRFVGYEGSEIYIQAMPIFELCASFGWSLVINPPDWSMMDIGLAIRSQAGYAALAWKSNVKLANLIARCVPSVVAREDSYLQFRSGAERWADNMQQMRQALDVLRDVGERRIDNGKMALVAHDLDLSIVADKYRSWLSQLSF